MPKPTRVAWSRPSTLVLIALVVANLALAAVNLRSRGGSGEPGPARAVPRPLPQLTVREAPAQAASPAAPATAAGGDAPPCHAFGPFEERRAARALAAKLALEEGTFRVLGADVAAPARFLVYVRTTLDDSAVRRGLGALEALGVESYVLERVAAEARLAAGVFSARARAEALQARLGDAGFDAAIRPLPRSRRLYYLLARVADPEASPFGRCTDVAPRDRIL